jgi:hypothetical protein
MDVEGLQELLSNFFSKDGEIECTVSTCDTCLQENKCEFNKEIRDKSSPIYCKEFIPKDWRAHISIAGDWWSQ